MAAGFKMKGIHAESRVNSLCDVNGRKKNEAMVFFRYSTSLKVITQFFLNTIKNPDATATNPKQILQILNKTNNTITKEPRIDLSL